MSLSQRWSGPSAVKIGLTRSSWTGVTQEAPHREESGGAQLLRAGLGGRRDEPNRIRATYRTGPGIRLVTDGTSGLPIWVASPGVSPGPTRSIPRSGHGSAGHTERGSDRSGELVDTVGRGCRRWCSRLGQWSRGAGGISWSASYRPPARPAESGPAAHCSVRELSGCDASFSVRNMFDG
jgi:hypothetical protein